VHIPDAQADAEYTYGVRHVDPIRSTVAVPMLEGTILLGVIVIYRLAVRPFTDKQISLVETFADQAAIAISNVGLFEEVQARNAELRVALEQQTATSELLKVIGRSPSISSPSSRPWRRTPSSCARRNMPLSSGLVGSFCAAWPPTTFRLHLNHLSKRTPSNLDAGAVRGAPRSSGGPFRSKTCGPIPSSLMAQRK